MKLPSHLAMFASVGPPVCMAQAMSCPQAPQMRYSSHVNHVYCLKLQPCRQTLAARLRNRCPETWNTVPVMLRLRRRIACSDVTWQW